MGTRRPRSLGRAVLDHRPGRYRPRVQRGHPRNSQSGKAGVAYLLEQEIAVGLPKVFQQELSIIASEEIDRHGREVTGEFVKDIFDAEYVNANVPWKLVSG